MADGDLQAGRGVAALGAAARALRTVRAEAILHRARDLADAAFVRSGRPPLRVRTDGVELRGFLRHRSFLADLTAGTHEPYLRELLLGELRPESTFLDVGAHVGLYTLLAAQRAREVVAFEADPYTARALAANVAGLPNVRVVAKAATDRVGPTQFWPSPGTYGSSLFARPSMGGTRSVAIEGTTIDAEVAGVADLVAKIDAEGAELQVLAGMTATLAGARRAVLVVEVNPGALAEAGVAAAELVARLRELRLALWRVDEPAGTVESLGGNDTGEWKGNLLCRSRA
ncbi:MAG: FkbM family methyltransferase [Gaiellaceae bacterium]